MFDFLLKLLFFKKLMSKIDDKWWIHELQVVVARTHRRTVQKKFLMTWITMMV